MKKITFTKLIDDELEYYAGLESEFADAHEEPSGITIICSEQTAEEIQRICSTDEMRIETL